MEWRPCRSAGDSRPAPGGWGPAGMGGSRRGPARPANLHCGRMQGHHLHGCYALCWLFSMMEAPGCEPSVLPDCPSMPCISLASSRSVSFLPSRHTPCTWTGIEEESGMPLGSYHAWEIRLLEQSSRAPWDPIPKQILRFWEVEQP